MASLEKSPIVDQAAVDVVSSSDSKDMTAVKLDGEHPMLQESPTRPKFQDVWATVLFIINFLVTLGIFVYCMTKASGVRMHGLQSEMLSIVFLSAGISLVATMLYMILMFFHPKILIHASYVCTTLILIALGIYLCVSSTRQYDGTRFIITAVVYFVLAVLNLTFYFLWRKRIPFSAVLLKATATTIKKYPGVIVLAIAMLFLQLGFIVFWSITVLLSFHCGISGHIVWYLIPSLYWNFEFMKNFLHTSVSGVFATYYFQTVSKEEAAKGVVSTAPENPTLFAISRSATYSFGSIAFGSLIIPMVQLLRSILCSSNTFVSAIGSCWCGFVERLFQCFNEYALAQVAIYGKPFVKAAKDTYALIKRSGLQVLMNEGIVDNVLFSAKIVCGLLTGTVGYAFSLTCRVLIADSIWMALCAFFLGYMLMGTFCEVIHSGMITTFVCYAEDPKALLKTKPKLYNRIMKALGQPEVQV